MEGFAQRRVGLDRQRDIFKASAHLERQGKRGREFGDAGADGVNSQNHIVVGARDDAHEALVVLQRHRPAIGAEGKPADADFAVRRLCGVGREPDGDDLRVGEADRGNGDAVEGALLAGDDLRHHLALRHRPVGEHRLAGHVADRPDVAHRSRALIVDAHERAAHRQIELLQVETAGAGASADGDQHLVGGDRPLLTVRLRDLQRALGERNRLRAGERLDAEVGEAARDRLGQLLIVERQDFGQRLDDRDPRAELGEGDAELKPDIAGADDGERSWNLSQRQRFGRRQDVAAEWQRRQFRRLRAGGDDKVLGLDAALAGIGAGDHGLAVDNRSRPQNRAHLRLLEQRADAAGEPGDDRILPADRLGEIELRPPDREPDRVQRLRLPQGVGGVGGVDQRLRGDAADVEASSAKPAGFDQDRVEAELAGADGRDIAARTAADDENLAAKLVHFVPAALRFRSLSPPRKRGSRRRVQREPRKRRGRCWMPAFAGMTLSTRQSSMKIVAGASISSRRR